MGVKIFPRSDLYRKNWDETFFDANKTDETFESKKKKEDVERLESKIASWRLNSRAR